MGGVVHDGSHDAVPVQPQPGRPAAEGRGGSRSRAGGRHPAQGGRRVIVPADGVWDDFFYSSGIAFPDRDQPAVPEREAW